MQTDVTLRMDRIGKVYIPVKTGALRKSLHFSVSQFGKNYDVSLTALDYYEFLDSGTRHIKPRELTKKILQDSAFDDITDEICTDLCLEQVNLIEDDLERL